MKSFYVAKRVMKQIIKDKRTLAMFFAAPVFVIFLLYVVLNCSIGKPKIQTVNLPTKLESAISKEAAVKKTDNKDKAMDDLKLRKTDAVITYDNNKISVNVEGSENSVTAAVKKAIASSIGTYTKDSVKKAEQQQKAQLQSNKSNRNSQFKNNTQSSKSNFQMIEAKYSYINGSDSMTTFDSIAVIMMGFFIFFFVFVIAGVSFLRERITGTLDRLLAAPIKRLEIVLGYFLGFGIFVLIQTIVIQMFMVYGLKISLKGNFLLLLIINILLAASSLSFGTLLSAFARNEMQLFQFIPIVIVPQILFCGLFELRGAPLWVVVLSKVFPMTYAADALTNVAFRGFGIASIIIDIIILALYTILFIVLNSLVLKKYRTL